MGRERAGRIAASPHGLKTLLKLPRRIGECCHFGWTAPILGFSTTSQPQRGRAETALQRRSGIAADGAGKDRRDGGLAAAADIPRQKCRPVHANRRSVSGQRDPADVDAIDHGGHGIHRTISAQPAKEYSSGGKWRDVAPDTFSSEECHWFALAYVHPV